MFWMKFIKSILDVDVQVVRCCLEHAASVAKIFLTSDVVVTEIKEAEPANAGGNPMDASGTCTFLLCYALIGRILFVGLFLNKVCSNMSLVTTPSGDPYLKATPIDSCPK
jgi:hypothetical protein